MRELTMDDSLNTDNKGTSRCWWCGDDPLYVDYHDNEWGHPVVKNDRLFEKVCLEGFQAGLSWITILRKREAFRESFCDFEIQKVAKLTQRDVNRLVKNASIIRHRGKIESTIQNAIRAIQLIDEFGDLASFFWSFRPSTPVAVESKAKIVAVTDESKAMSRALKKRGWSFVGPTTCYAFMQSMGMVNDHLIGCHRYQPVEAMKRPV